MLFSKIHQKIILLTTASLVFCGTFASARTLSLKIPPQCRAEPASGTILAVNPNEGEYQIQDFDDSKPLSIGVTDPFGTHIRIEIPTTDFDKPTIVGDKILQVPYANPESLDGIPKLCPRSKMSWEAGGRHKLTYEASEDWLNNKPRMQFLDPDFSNSPSQIFLFTNFDEHNVLSVRHVKISYDYEDTKIVDVRGINPLTGKPYRVNEGEGGFYANFHYAVVPYRADIATLPHQELLSLAEGRLSKIDRVDLAPSLRAHSFLPGPYLSRTDWYTMCEWGDTAYQALSQEMSYKNLSIWDWDLQSESDTNTDRVLLIVWEGDEEDWLLTEGLIDPYTITDDLVAVFDIKRSETLKPLILKNPVGNPDLKNNAGDFEIVVQTIQ